ncbi:glycoside hydrolase superfamily [Fimicolochytrium jonesii]|uniref:glycoside hydrolase superfamily n=1 Tax=Fimicolochytrium jonesii TaxID=1396493 RepID=UPI0022FE2CA8|nr:glycoside hydrolase superfamily [Fimicolochytrium jonesii]KAI8822992.1 glycoside hydrolase superfamily [Fimicolochytrium jonesii]
MRQSSLVSPLLLAAAVLAAPQSTASPNDWDKYLAKAKQLVDKLNLDEKIVLTTGVGWGADVGNPCVGNIGPVEKIGFPGYCLQDGPAGIRFPKGVSVFPAGINYGAAFDKTLHRARGEKMGAEFRGKGINIGLTACVDIARVPEGGRQWEGYGADPYVASVGVSNFIEGMSSQGVITTVKHFALNNQEHGRELSSSNVDDRTFREIYLPAYEAAISAGVGAVMCSYNLVNGTYACENDRLLNGVLKKDLGFKGFVMSDWWAAKTDKAPALAGTDMMMPGTKVWGSHESWWGANLAQLVKAGQVPEARLDDMAVRILAPWLKSGQNKGFPATNFNSFNGISGPDVQKDHKKHIREVGAASSILLKNKDETLPLTKKLKSIAVIGEDAATPADPNQFADRAGVNGTVALGWGSGTAEFPYLVGPFDGIKTQASALKIPVAASLSNTDLAKAVAVAKKADVAVVFAFADSGEGYLNVEGNQGDRNDLHLWHGSEALIKAVADVNKNTVVVIHAPGPILLDSFIDHPNVKSVIHALLPGQESGNAIADVLFGKVNPSGRLPFTINRKAEDWGVHVTYFGDIPADSANKCITCPNITYSEGLLVDYRYNQAKKVKPLFPFGYGLSYTKFIYSQLSAKVTRNSGRPTAVVKVDVKNSGHVAGHEVVQLYVQAPKSAGKAFRELKGFERVFLKPGQVKTVSLTLTTRDFSYWSTQKQKWVVPKGDFGIYAGPNSGDLPKVAKITL